MAAHWRAGFWCLSLKRGQSRKQTCYRSRSQSRPGIGGLEFHASNRPSRGLAIRGHRLSVAASCVQRSTVAQHVTRSRDVFHCCTPDDTERHARHGLRGVRMRESSHLRHHGICCADQHHSVAMCSPELQCVQHSDVDALLISG